MCKETKKEYINRRENDILKKRENGSFVKMDCALVKNGVNTTGGVSYG